MKKINRRNFLAYTATSGFFLTTGISLTACNETEHNRPKELIIGGYSQTDNMGKRLKEYGVVAFQVKDNSQHTQNNYQIIGDFAVPHEVHLAAPFPDNQSILICSRKPKASLLRYSLSGELLAELKPLPNQHFEGHAIFSRDGQYLYVTASDYQQGSGKLLRLNSQDLSLVNVYESGGIGPHELVWQADNIIAIANTGVLTHPDTGREILNVNTIQSNVVLFDTKNEIIEHTWPIPLLGLSARHLDCMDNHDLVIGCQYKKQDQRPPCVAFANKDKGMVFSESKNEMLHWNMKGYTASIKAIPQTQHALISNPQGHLLTQWENKSSRTLSNDGRTQRVDQYPIEFNKGIKVTQNGKQAWISKGAGSLLSLNLSNNKIDTTKVNIKENIWWANHLG